MSRSTRQTGAQAEQLILEYLKKKSWTPLAQNYMTPYGEVDLIFLDGSTYVFVEVKARSSTKFGYPAEAVTKNKRLRYLKSAQYYFSSEGMEEFQARFDIAEVYFYPEKPPHIHYLENAYDFTDIGEFY